MIDQFAEKETAIEQNSALHTFAISKISTRLFKFALSLNPASSTFIFCTVAL
jgi:hypothetical protein